MYNALSKHKDCLPCRTSEQGSPSRLAAVQRQRHGRGQRSQVLRKATVDEFILVPDATHYKFSFKNRRFNTASSAGTSFAPPVSHFMLSPHQSMITRFIAIVGHRFCGTLRLDNEARRMFVDTKGQSWTQKDTSSRFKRIGMHWFGICSFGPHVCQTFWSTHALHCGRISGSNLEDFLRNSYMAASANTTAHTVGTRSVGGGSKIRLHSRNDEEGRSAVREETER